MSVFAPCVAQRVCPIAIEDSIVCIFSLNILRLFDVSVEAHLKVFQHDMCFSISFAISFSLSLYVIPTES